MSFSTNTKVLICPSKSDVPSVLHDAIIKSCKESLASHDCFTIAMSGGSLPSFLGTVSKSFEKAEVDPCFSKWHVALADERLVPSTHEDSNLKALRDNFLCKTTIPEAQIYGIDESLLLETAEDGSDEKLAAEYQTRGVEAVVAKSKGRFDCILLGFGPDGHTCSLFPDHALLDEKEKKVTNIADSPKPPPRRITLTYPVLDAAECSILCGAGGSKSPILKACFDKLEKEDGYEGEATAYKVVLSNPPPYPCARVKPTVGTMTWIVDADAAKELPM